MAAERRHETRHIVDGLRAELDGEPHEILDLSATGVRVVRANPPPLLAELRLVAEDDRTDLDVKMTGFLQRTTAFEAIYRYRCPLAHWPETLADFDVFADLSLAVLEDGDGT